MKKYGYIVLLVAACAAFFYQTIIRGLIPAPTDTLIGLYHPWLDQAAITNPSGVPYKNFLITDPIRQQIPWRKIVIDSFKNGKLPRWNPYNFSGTPLLANIQAGTFYPLNILFFFLPFQSAWTALIIFQPVFAATFLYLYLRNKKINGLAAATAGLAWAFSGFSVAWLTWGTIVQTALWLPLILLSVDNIYETKRPVVWVGIFAAASAFAFFAGHAQMALYIFILSAVYAAFRFSWWTVAAAGIALFLTSIQWIPFIQLARHSARVADSSAWLKEGWFLPWQNLAQFIAPDLFGNPATLNYTGIWNYGEFIGYIGILPLIFSLWAVISRRDRFTRFFGITAGIVFLFLLPTPLARLPYQIHVPILATLQPTRLMVLIDFCLVVLAALGIDHYIKNPSKKILIIIGVVGLVLAGMWTVRSEVARHNLVLPSVLLGGSAALLVFSSKKWKNLWLFAVFVFVAFDLFRFGWKFTPFTTPDYFFPKTQVISFLQSQQKPFRVMSLDNRAIPPNVTAYYGIETPEGYDPIYDSRYEEFIAALNRKEPNIKPPFGFNRIITLSTIDSPLFPLLNVKYVIALDDINSPDVELMYREGNTRVYWYKKALPRRYSVESLVLATSKQQTFDTLYSKTFDPAKEAVVEEAITIPVGSHFEVISETFDPGWKAYIDGRRVPVYRADYIFQGVVVPAGQHSLEMRYN